MEQTFSHVLVLEFPLEEMTGKIQLYSSEHFGCKMKVKMHQCIKWHLSRMWGWGTQTSPFINKKCWGGVSKILYSHPEIFFFKKCGGGVQLISQNLKKNVGVGGQKNFRPPYHNQKWNSPACLAACRWNASGVQV